ncbi:hypothetical protein DPMN_057175 [Dreissena polymorpha]|uniref:Uncharacterized protein n=1 Tax=Dreissena polymorpha TaxID=45954 RepID=A0A9D4HTX3_DREPO|nr:hypothetical protein DPMN_057175 [Dreissena polymorpha]
MVTSRVFTRFLYNQITKTAPPTGGHVFQPTGTTFELNQHIIKTNILTNFKLDQAFIGTNHLTKFHVDRTRNFPFIEFSSPMAVFQRTGTTFELNQHIIKTTILTIFELDRGIIVTNLLTKFHEDQTRNVASRVFTKLLYNPIRKTDPPTGGHVFQQAGTTFELKQHIIKTRNVASRVFTR